MLETTRIKRMKILVLNSGSSSLKFQLFNMKNFDLLASGRVERIGEKHSFAHMKYATGIHQKKTVRQPACQDYSVTDHQQAIEIVLGMLRENNCLTGMEELAGIGHRVVHGGENFNDPVLITDQVINTIERLIPLAPLHNPANLAGIRVAKQRAPEIPQVAVFDTSFHQSIPEHAYIYGLPYTLYEEHQVRRYGFHGTSHHYVVQQAANYLDKRVSKLKLISLHLGNGTSAAAVQFGKSIDTSMGMTPLEGIIMGTRCGDIDPAIPFYLARETGKTLQEIENLLNKQSGLKGICGQNDMRAVVKQAENGDAGSKLAIRIFCYHIKKYIGAYMAALNGIDAIIFTGGIGENSSLIRGRSCENLQNLGIDIDPVKNNASSNKIREIHCDSAQIKVLVIPTNEELAIAMQTVKLVCP